MLKRMIGLCMAALMLFSLLPAAVWAEEDVPDQTAAAAMDGGAAEQEQEPAPETPETPPVPETPEDPAMPEESEIPEVSQIPDEITGKEGGVIVQAAASVSWYYQSQTDTLHICGSGDIDDYTTPPWESFLDASTVIIDEGITSIGNNSFAQMGNLTSVTIPKTVTRIGQNAFYNCEKLASITIPASVTKIDYNAFLSCSGLKDVSFSGSVPTIASNAFQFCPKFTIHLTDPKTWVASDLYDSTANTWNGYPVSFSSRTYDCGDLSNGTFWELNTAGILTFTGEGELNAPTGSWTWASFSPLVYRIVLKGNITAIGNDVFCNMENLGAVELPDTLVTIGERAFKNCPKLTKVVIPQATMAIGDEAFANCTGLETVQVNSWLCEAEKDAFTGCTALDVNGTFYGTRIYYAVQEAIDQHSGSSSSYAPVNEISSFSVGDAVVTYYENGLCIVARYRGQNSGQVTKTVGNIGSSTFLYIGDGIDLIGSGAFQDKTSLRTIRFPENDLTIQSKAFQGCGVEQLDFSDTAYTYSLGDYCFAQCTNLKSIDFGSTQIKPMQCCFEDCTALESVRVTKNVVMDGSYTSGYGMFHNCSALKSAVVDCSFIPPFFFENDKALTSVTFSDPDVQFYWLEHDSDSGHMFNTSSKDWGSINLIGYECSQVSAFVDASNKRNSDPYVHWPALTFESIAGDSKAHTEVIDAAVAATCTETGLTAGSHCSRCGKVLTAQETTPATGHTEVIDPAKAPTCTETGLTAGSHCSHCGKVLTAQETTPATGHTEVVDAAVAATCTKTGLTAGSHCSRCGTVLTAQETTPATGHTVVIDAAVAATCTKTGLTAGSHCSRCETVLTAQETTPATGHTEVVDAAVAATCTESGLTEGAHCSVCHTVLAPQITLDATGHTEVIDAAVEPTCIKIGKTEGKHCSVCNMVLVQQNVIPAAGHCWDNGTITKPANGKATGIRTFTCTVCQATKTEMIPIVTGDVNGDGKTNILDIDEIYRYLTGQTTFSSEKMEVADLNGDNVVDVYDLQRLYEAVSGIRPF